MPEVVACSTNESFIILQSVGVAVYIDSDIKNVEKQIESFAAGDTKIIIYDTGAQNFVQTLLEKYEDKMYPIFLKLPSGLKDEDTLLEMKTLIEKSIGISMI